MAKPNVTDTDRWAGESEPEPMQFWMISAGAETTNCQIVAPEIWVPVTQH